VRHLRVQPGRHSGLPLELLDQGVFGVILVLPFLLAGERVQGAGLVSLLRKEVLGLDVVNALFKKILDQKFVVGLVCRGQR
jgi:hypothetical protein